MRAKRRKQCADKYRWPTMEAAHSYCFHKRHAGVNIQAYHCRHCGGIHVGHFRQDDLPAVEVIMSKTRVYTVFCGESREGPIFLAREEALEFLRHLQQLRLMEKDINEDEYARMCADEMEQRARQTARNPWPESGAVVYSNPAVFPKDSWMSNEGWTDCTDRPDIPKRGAR